MQPLTLSVLQQPCSTSGLVLPSALVKVRGLGHIGEAALIGAGVMLIATIRY